MVSRESALTPSPVLASACGSRSITRVGMPAANAADASPKVTEVLPTPPFKLLMLTTCTERTTSFSASLTSSTLEWFPSYHNRVASRSLTLAPGWRFPIGSKCFFDSMKDFRLCATPR